MAAAAAMAAAGCAEERRGQGSRAASVDERGTQGPAPAVAAEWSAGQKLARGPADRGGTVFPFHSPARAAVDAQGRAIVVWAAPVRHGARTSPVRVATARAGRRFGKPRVVARDGELPEIGVAPDGRAVLAWTDQRGTYVATGSVTGAFGAPERVAPASAGPQVAMAHDGVAVVLWSARDRVAGRLVPGGKLPALGHGEPGERDVSVAADGTIAFRAGARIGIRAPGEPLRFVPAPRLEGAYDATVAAGPRGAAGVAGTDDSGGCGEVACYGRPVFSELPPGADRFGPVQQAPLAGRKPVAFGANLAYTADGGRVLTWIEDTKPDIGWETETASGRAYAWSTGRPQLLDRRATTVELRPASTGVLALSEGRGWTASLAGAGAARRVAAPPGRPTGIHGFHDRSLAVAGEHAVLAWEQLPDLGVHVARATLRPRP